MKKLLILALLALSFSANAANTFFRANGDTSVVIGPVCVPEDEGVVTYGDLDYNTSSLDITIYASGDGVDSSFNYTGGDIDDYDGTPPAWGDPTTDAIEVEADDDCVRLHIRDEVFAVSNATEWTIRISDGGTLIMDWDVDIIGIERGADVAEAVAAFDLSTETTAGSLSKAIQDIETDATAILTDTGTTLDGKINTIDGNVDSILVDTGTTIPGTISTVDSNVDAIKAKTDDITFTNTNEVDVNVKSMNDAEVCGDGTSGDKWTGDCP